MFKADTELKNISAQLKSSPERGKEMTKAGAPRIFRRRGQEGGKKQANNVRAASVDGEPPEVGSYYTRNIVK